MYGCGTWGHGLLVAMAVVGEWLDLMILEDFPNYNDSVML